MLKLFWLGDVSKVIRSDYFSGVMLVPNQTMKLMITLGVLVQGISILPVTYKLFNRRRNNYEKSIS